MINPDVSTHKLLHAASEARACARSAGRLPSLAWDDIDADPTPPTCVGTTSEVDDLDIEIAIDRVLRGQSVALTLAERDVLIDRLTWRGHSLLQLSRMLGISVRTVSRRRVAVRSA